MAAFQLNGVYYKWQKKTNKLLVLGVDGLDPRLVQKYLDEGKMPNTKKFLEKGAAHTRMEMIGGQPNGYPSNVDHLSYWR